MPTNKSVDDTPADVLDKRQTSKALASTIPATPTVSPRRQTDVTSSPCQRRPISIGIDAASDTILSKTAGFPAQLQVHRLKRREGWRGS
jgi:hypothetical protein